MINTNSQKRPLNFTLCGSSAMPALKTGTIVCPSIMQNAIMGPIRCNAVLHACTVGICFSNFATFQGVAG